jgi:hypothetical protein
MKNILYYQTIMLTFKWLLIEEEVVLWQKKLKVFLKTIRNSLLL